jgi:ubiquinone/menaquinone biosynthesis C-methylase UbiE
MSGADAARAYDEWYEQPLGSAAHRIETQMIAQAAGPRAGERALDVGCGTGIYTRWLTDLGLVVTGIDRDPVMLAAARRKVPSAQFHHADAHRLPFADAEFDLVLAVTVMCFVERPMRSGVVRELARVTRPGGRVVIGELAPYSLWALGRRVSAWRGSRMWRSAHFTSGSQLRRLMREAGIAPTLARYGLYLPPLQHAALTTRAARIERACRWLGPVGAAFVVVRGDLPAAAAGTSHGGVGT